MQETILKIEHLSKQFEDVEVLKVCVGAFGK